MLKKSTLWIFILIISLSTCCFAESKEEEAQTRPNPLMRNTMVSGDTGIVADPETMTGTHYVSSVPDEEEEETGLTNPSSARVTPADQNTAHRPVTTQKRTSNTSDRLKMNLLP